MTKDRWEDRWENTVWDTDIYLDDLDGKEPLTNEEWLKQANTEQLAECLARYFYGWTTNSAPYDIVLHSVMEWLKQPHTAKE